MSACAESRFPTGVIETSAASHGVDLFEAAPAILLIAHEDRQRRAALRSIFSEEGGFAASVEGSTAVEAIMLTMRVHPSAALLSARLGGQDMETVRSILECAPKCRLVVLDGRPNRSVLLAALRAGASAYVVPDERGERVREALLPDRDRAPLPWGRHHGMGATAPGRGVCAP
jgi:ActR/RegA family two-component response regulator